MPACWYGPERGLVEARLQPDSGPATRRARPWHGSGAIALVSPEERPGWQVTATDLSAAGTDRRPQNALRLGLDRIEFMLGDWFGPLGVRRFDLIASNPPYVAAGDAALAAAACLTNPGRRSFPVRRPRSAEVIIREAPKPFAKRRPLAARARCGAGASAEKLSPRRIQ